ncbi:MAG: alkanesulfonate monooxygenase SsuD [Parasphingorhabdus sp.]|jgi:alkanesulfonate monooxygenase SsuD/methylene tetrahydromethanopterin reductase-like flavin-dependent oxidoreductase (luciferase family)
MKFGIFHLMPRRDPDKPDSQVFSDVMEQTHIAEQMEFDIAWFAEHHFSNYCLCPSPLVMAAYCAPQTSKIRLGTACLVTPLYNPVRMIEEIAMVDALSDGRVVVGLGSGYQDYEFKRFGVELDKAKEIFKETLDIYELAFANGEYEYHGKYFDIPLAPLALNTIQKPIPETWITGLSDSPHLMERIARSGYVPFATAGPRQASALVGIKSRWSDVYSRVGKDPDQVPFAIQRNLFITNSAEEARQAADNARYTGRVAGSMRNKTQQLKGSILVESAQDGELGLAEIEQNTLIGSADKVAEQLISEIETIQPMHISLFVQFGSLPQAQVMNSMQAFGEKVLPQLQRHFGDLEQIGTAIPTQTPEA